MIRRLINRFDLNDIMALLGLGLLGVGLYLVDLALALAVIGGIMLIIGLVGAYRRGQS